MATLNTSIRQKFVDVQRGSKVRILANETKPQCQQGTKLMPELEIVYWDLRRKEVPIWECYPGNRKKGSPPHSVSVQVEGAMFNLPATSEFLEILEL